MKTFIVFVLVVFLLFLVVFGFALFTLKHFKGTKLYNFVKRHLITDEDLESR